MQARKPIGLNQKNKSDKYNGDTSIISDNLARKILLSNSERIWHLGLLSAMFIIFFLILDYVRWQEGLFSKNAVYFWLFICHIGAAFSSIAAVILFRNNENLNELKPRDLKRIQYIYLSLFFLPYTAMGMLSFIERGSFILLCILLIALNLVFVIKKTERIILNMLMLFLFWAAVIMQYSGDLPASIAQLTESLGYVITSFFMGQIQYRQVIKNLHQDMQHEEQMKEIALERKRNNELLLNLLPKGAVLELKKYGFIQARTYEQSTVCILELSNFREQSNKMSAVRLIRELNRYYTEFDRILSNYGLEKIRAGGYVYVFTSGLPEVHEGAVTQVLHAAGFMLKFVHAEENAKKAYGAFTARIGIHSGPLGAGVVGDGRFSYEIWGDTLTMARVIKNMAHDNEILISEVTRNLLLNCKVCTLRGSVQLPDGKPMDVYNFQF
jgi:class 3 adenylate cyclase